MRSKSMLLLVLFAVASLLLASCAPAAPTPAPMSSAPTQAPKPAESTKAPEKPAATQAPAALEPTAAVEYPPAPEYIEVGASIPLTGKYGSLGSQVKAGYDYAVADINAAGGVFVKEYGKNIPLRLTAYDDESDPTKAVSKLESLYAEQQVVAYLGGAASDMHAATAAIAEKNKVPYLGVSFALWQIHQQGYKYLFSPFVKSPDQATDVYEYLNAAIPNKEDRPTKVAIFQETTDWGIELGKMWKAYAHPNGYEVVYYGEYAPRTQDYSQMILAAKAAGANMMLSMPGPPDGIALMKQMVELDWAPKFIMMIRAPEGITWADTFGKDGNYVTIFPGWHNGETFPGVSEVNAKHQADFGRPADLLVGPAYACVQVLADSIERAGTLDRDTIRDAVAATNMMTVEGPVTFRADGTGDVLNPMIQWINGQQELVWPPEMATAKFAYPAPPYAER